MSQVAFYGVTINVSALPLFFGFFIYSIVFRNFAIYYTFDHGKK